MGFLLIGVIFTIVTYKLFEIAEDSRSIVPCIMIPLSFIISISAFIFSAYSPLPVNYEEPKLYYSTELVSLNDTTSVYGTGNRYYLSVTPDNAYTYYYEVYSPYANIGEKAYDSNTISSEHNNVTIIETDAKNATLQVYVQKVVKKNFWTFNSSHNDIYEWIFRVPKGTILRQAVLGN